MNKKLFPARSFWTGNAAKAMIWHQRETVQMLTRQGVLILDGATIVDGVLKKYKLHIMTDQKGHKIMY